VIRSFRDVESAKLFRDEPRKRFQAVERTARRKPYQLDQARSLIDLSSLPGNRREALRGARAGQYSIRINDQFRICFTWSEGDAYKVEIVDYH
jgi:proteic killer suppression protein